MLGVVAGVDLRFYTRDFGGEALELGKGGVRVLPVRVLEKHPSFWVFKWAGEAGDPFVALEYNGEDLEGSSVSRDGDGDAVSTVGKRAGGVRVVL